MCVCSGLLGTVMKNLVPFRVVQNGSLGCSFSPWHVLGGLLLCGPYPVHSRMLSSILGLYLQMPVVHPLSCDSQKCVRCQMSPEGQNHPRLKNHWFKASQFRPLRLLWSKSKHLNRFKKSDRLCISLWCY